MQAGAAFVLWVAYGVFLWRRSTSIRERVGRGTRTGRALKAAGMLFGGAALLLAGMVAIDKAGGFGETAMAPWAWLAVTLLGGVFVHLQTLAGATGVVLVQESVTEEARSASIKRQESEDARKRDG